jgi:hypothetical protein
VQISDLHPQVEVIKQQMLLSLGCHGDADLIFGQWCHVRVCCVASVSEEPIASIFRVEVMGED